MHGCRRSKGKGFIMKYTQLKWSIKQGIQTVIDHGFERPRANQIHVTAKEKDHIEISLELYKDGQYLGLERITHKPTNHIIKACEVNNENL
jgi:hypothetical protein